MSQFIKAHIKQAKERYDLIKTFAKEQISKRNLKDSFWVLDIQNVYDRINIWRKLMPRVQIFYAAKCNQNIEVGKACVEMNTGFDVASANEIKRFIELGAKPENMIYANPCKQDDHILYAKKFGLKKMTFDSVEELYKIKKLFPEAECIIRISSHITDRSAFVDLSKKFGA